MFSVKTGTFCHSEPKFDLRDNFTRRQKGYFSCDAKGKVSIDQSQLNGYNLESHNTNLNVQMGSNGYKPKIFKNCSQLKDMLTALLMLESQGSVNIKDYQLICQSNFFQSAALLKQSEYYVVKYKDQIFICNTDSREGQHSFMSYIGIRFEDLVTLGPNCPPTINNNSSYNSLVETTIGGMKCIYTCEVDTFKQSPGLSGEVPDSQYTEIKLMLSRKIPLKNAKNQDILKVLRKGNNSYEDFLYRLNVQCRFGNNHNVLIGIRDAAFNVRLIREFSLSNDIERSFKSLRNPVPPGLTYNYAIGGYDGYLRSVDYIEGILDLIKRAINAGNDVCKVRIRTNEIDVVPITSKIEKDQIIKLILFKELRNRL